MLEQWSEIVGRAINLRTSVKANVVRSESSIARDIPRRYSGGDTKPSGDVRTRHLAEEEESEVYVGEPLSLSPSRLPNVRSQRILADGIITIDSTEGALPCIYS